MPGRESQAPGGAAASLSASAEARLANVGHNSSVLAIGTMGSRVLGFVRNALFAAIAGTAFSGDAFTLANNLPTIIYTVIATGVVTGILIPQITKAMKRSDGGDDFVNRLLTLSILVILIAAVACTVGAPWLIHLTMAAKARAVPGYLQLAKLLAYWCMPQIFFYGLYAVLGQVLNARGHFTAFAWAPALANVVQIAGLVWFLVQWGFQPDPARWSTNMIVVLGASTTLGIALQGLCLIWPLYKDGFRFRPRFGWRGYGFGAVSRMTMWTFAIVLVTTPQTFVLMWLMTAMRGEAGNFAGTAVQQYALALSILPTSLITVSVVSALFPGMSSAWQDGDNSRMKTLVRQGLITPSILVIPSSVALIALGIPIIQVVYGHRLTSGDAHNVWLVMAAYCLGNWVSAITRLAQRYYFAKQNGWMNFRLVLVPIGVQFLVVAPVFLWTSGQYGVASLAAGDTLGSAVAAGLFLWLARHEMGHFGLRGLAWLWVKVTVAAALAGMAGWGAVHVLTYGSTSRLFSVLLAGVGAVVFCLVFWGVSALLRIEEVMSLVSRVLARVLRRPTSAVPEQETDADVTRVIVAPVSGVGSLSAPAAFEPTIVLTPPPQPPRPPKQLRPPEVRGGMRPPPQPRPPEVATPPQPAASAPHHPPRGPTPPPQPSAPPVSSMPAVPSVPAGPASAPAPPPQPWLRPGQSTN